MLTHIKLVHAVGPDDSPNTCSICMNIFKDEHELLEHRQSEHDIKIESSKCEICLKVFWTSGSFNLHHAKEHNKICQFCGKSFQKPSDRIKHEIRLEEVWTVDIVV